MRWPRPIGILAAALWLANGFSGGAARAQLANPVINEFEMSSAGSLEWDIMYRMASTRRYDPRDLPRLARLTVLETIAMYENVRADLPATAFGARIEGEMSLLWDAAELFYVSAMPGDAASLVRSRPLLGDVEATYRRLQASLGTMPGLSDRASFHLQDVSRLLPVMDTLMDAMENDQGIPLTAPAVPAANVVGEIQQTARAVVQELETLTRSLQAVRPPPRQLDRLSVDVDGLAEGLKSLDGALAAGDDRPGLLEALRTVRSRLWLVDAALVRDVRDPRVLDRWRRLRQQVNMISDRFGRSRVIAIPPENRPAATADRRMLAGADRAVAALDVFLTKESTAPAAPGGGSQFQVELDQMRRRLLAFRQQVAAAEPAAALGQSLRDLDDLNRRLSSRAQAESRIFRRGARLDTRELEGLTRALQSLHSLLAAPAAGEPAAKAAS